MCPCSLLTVFLWRRLGPSVLGPIAIAVGLAAAAELLQGLVGRSAGLGDFVRGVLGTLAAGAGIAAWQARLRPARAFAWLLALMALVAWPLYQVVPLPGRCLGREPRLPGAGSLPDRCELFCWRSRQAEMIRIDEGDGGAAA